MKVTTVGIDLAKNVFQVHGVDERGKALLRKQLKRGQMVAFFARLEPCLIGMEACGSAHHWARKLQALGHEAKLMAPKFVKPYVKGNKHDVADAEAICEAVRRPNMRFVAIKTVEQQGILAVHRARQGFVKARTAQANQIRGLLAEFGIVIPKGLHHVSQALPGILEEAENGLSGAFRQLLRQLGGNLKYLDEQAGELEREIVRWHRDNEASCRLAGIDGIGPLTASALVATMGDSSSFERAREVPAWLGLVPRQQSTGGKPKLLGMSKRGDTYVRTLLIHGARSVVQAAARKPQSNPWLSALLARRNKNVATVALANKNARIAWALLAHGGQFEREHRAVRAAG